MTARIIARLNLDHAGGVHGPMLRCDQR
jgi:hypothetical protein